MRCRDDETAGRPAPALLTPVALFISGSNVTLQKGAPIIAYVDVPVEIGRPAAANSPAPAPNGPEKLQVLRNGDKITGQVAGLADGVYTVVAKAGTLQINASEVKEIKEPETK